MATQEQYQPETNTPETVVADYRHSLALMNTNYRVGITDIVRDLSATSHLAGQQLDEVMQRCEIRLTGITAAAPAYLSQVIDETADKLQSGLNPGDSDLLAQARAVAQKEEGIGTLDSTMAIGDILIQASSLKARDAMKVILDGEVWAQARAVAQKEDIGTYGSMIAIDDILRKASSREAGNAMKAALDGEVWAQAQTAAQREGASTLTGRVAIDGILREASSPEVRNTMEALIEGRPRSYSWPFGSAMGNDTYANFFKRAFGQDEPRQDEPKQDESERQQQGSGSQSAPPPRQESARKARDYTEVDEIVRRVRKRAEAKEDKWSDSWLEREEKAKIYRVIGSVRTIRRQGEEKGETITDREIYFRYRRTIDTGNLDPERLTRLTDSAKILLALMGGKPKGELPF